uniref:(northern house mosquito) hypothetical protein n=1 Tax=Culex pipiens TaxID=7175 RepID=A0A8D8GAX8_CULPI
MLQLLLTCFQMVVRLTSSDMLILPFLPPTTSAPFSSGSCRLSAECRPESWNPISARGKERKKNRKWRNVCCNETKLEGGVKLLGWCEVEEKCKKNKQPSRI